VSVDIILNVCSKFGLKWLLHFASREEERHSKRKGKVTEKRKLEGHERKKWREMKQENEERWKVRKGDKLKNK
jgi:hypothetical protein